MLKYLFLNIKHFLSKLPRFYFSIPKRSSLIIFDDLNSKYIKDCIEYKKIYEIKFRNNQINIFALLYAVIFFYKSSIKLEYINFFLLRSKANILITSNFNRLIIYQIKKYHPKIKVIVIQNGTFGNDFVEKLKNSKYENFICDYFFCMTALEKEKIKKIIKSKFIVLGSLKNNFYKIKSKYKKKQILYISQFRKSLLNNPSVKAIYDTEKLLLPIVFHFCKKKKLKFVILPGEEDSSSENMHYQNLLKSKNFLLHKRNIDKSYQRIDESLLSISIDSTLGYEALSRHNKVGIFDFFSYNHKSFLSKSFFKRAGNFYLGFYNRQKIDNILEYLYTVDQKKWKSKNSNKLNLIPYIRNNSKFKIVVNRILEE